MIKSIKNISKPILGIWSIIPSPVVGSIVGSSGMDFIIIDLEHGYLDMENIGYYISMTEREDCNTFVRAMTLNEGHILHILETGCKNILVPHVSNKQQCVDLINWCKYYPDGNRGLSPYTINHKYHHKTTNLKNNNDRLTIGVLVEGATGINNLKDICTVPDIDIIYTGIYDISQSIGKPGELMSDECIVIQKESIKIIKDSGKIPASFCRNREEMKMLLDNGYEMIAYLTDCAILKEGCENAIKEFESINR